MPGSKRPSIAALVAPTQVGASLRSDQRLPISVSLAPLAVHRLSAQAVDQPLQPVQEAAPARGIRPPTMQRTQRARLARSSLRQSTRTQVRSHTGSTTRQYDRAARIQVVDQGQGQAGSTARGRAGCPWRVAEVGCGPAGAVLSVEASRLARTKSDWHRLLEICALPHTLVSAEAGISDPTAANDRLLLGCKGALSAAELPWLRQRMQGGPWRTRSRANCASQYRSAWCMTDVARS
jgi:hypothetical protein